MGMGPTLCIRCECRKVITFWEVLSDRLAVLDSRIARNFRAVVRLRVDLGSIDCITFECKLKLRTENTDRLVKLPQDGAVYWDHLGPNCLRVGRHARASTANCFAVVDPTLCPGRDNITAISPLFRHD